MKNIHPRHRQAHHLILDLEWNAFSDATIPAKVFLIAFLERSPNADLSRVS